MLVLANHPGRLSLQDVTANVAEIASIQSRKELKELLANLRKMVEQFRSQYGVRASRSQILALVDWIQRNIDPGQACYLPVGMLSNELSLYSDMKLSPHARISIDIDGTWRDYPGGFEVRLLEASLYEDMCSLFNLLHESHKSIPEDRPAGAMDLKIAAKRHVALMRATMSSAFYFVESYVNGLATDYLYNHTEQLTEKDRLLLTEWDSTKSRFRSLSMRDKLVQYPRIMTRSTYPPIDENNCAELRYFVNTAKDFRDAVVHASPSFDPIDDYPKKEKLFMALKQDEVTKIVDTSIALVRKIETTVKGSAQKWLRDRSENGLFADDVFE